MIQKSYCMEKFKQGHKSQSIGKQTHISGLLAFISATQLGSEPEDKKNKGPQQTT